MNTKRDSEQECYSSEAGHAGAFWKATKEMDVPSTIRTSVTAAMCVAVAAIAFAGNASAGPMNMVSSPVIKTPSATEQIYYRRYGGYYRRGYAYGPRYYYGRPAYGYGYGYPYAYPVVPVPLPVPSFGW